MEDALDGRAYPAVTCELLFELLAAGSSEPVVACPPVFLRSAPLARDPTLQKHPLQRGIERSFIDAQHVFGPSLDSIRDFEAMQLCSRLQRLQDQHVERPRRNLFADGGQSHYIDILRHAPASRNCSIL